RRSVGVEHVTRFEQTSEGAGLCGGEGVGVGGIKYKATIGGVGAHHAAIVEAKIALEVCRFIQCPSACREHISEGGQMQVLCVCSTPSKSKMTAEIMGIYRVEQWPG